MWRCCCLRGSFSILLALFLTTAAQAFLISGVQISLHLCISLMVYVFVVLIAHRLTQQWHAHHHQNSRWNQKIVSQVRRKSFLIFIAIYLGVALFVCLKITGMCICLMPHKSDIISVKAGYGNQIFDPYSFLSTTLPISLTNYQPIISESELASIYELVQIVDSACESHGLVCLLNHGGLIGSLRHHSIIPWDDDIDLMHNVSQWRELVHVLNSISSSYKAEAFDLSCGSGYDDFNPKCWRRIVFYQVKGVYCSCRYPYIDLVPFRDYNMSHIQGQHGQTFYRRDAVFPLCKRRLGPLLVTAPRDGAAVLNAHYGSDWQSTCKTHERSHKYERANYWIQGRTAVHCEELKPYFPFVERKKIGNGKMEETLVVNGTTYDSGYVDNCAE